MTFTHVDFLTFGDSDTPDAGPSDEPRDVKGLENPDDSVPLTYGPPTQRLTMEAYQVYRATRKLAWKAWQEAQAAAEAAAQAAAEVATKEAAEPLLVTLRDQAQAAITSNDTFLELTDAAMTAAKVRDQVKDLTRQNTKIIKAVVRLVLGKTLA